MTREVFYKIVCEAQDALGVFHIHDALFLIKSLLRNINKETLQIRFESIKRDYNAMLDFLGNGGIDPNQEIMQKQMASKTYELLSQIDAVNRQNDTNDHWTECRNQISDDTNIFECLENDNIIFSYALTRSIELRDDEIETISILYDSLNLDRKKIFISSLCLGLWDYFNATLFRWLCHMSQSNPIAFTGVVFAIIRYKKIIPLFPNCEDSIHELSLSSQSAEWLAIINRHLFMCSQSDKIEKKVQCDIIPNIIDGAKDEHLRMGFFNDEHEEDAFEKLIQNQEKDSHKIQEKKNNKFYKSAMQLIAMQQEGADINLDLFVNAMRMPFFQSLANWFKPFNPKDESIQHITYKNGHSNYILKMAFERGNMCDADKYAFSLLFDKVTLRNEIKGYFQDILKEVETSETDNFTDYEFTPPSDIEMIKNNIRIYYRLFEKSKWKTDFENLFKYPYDFLQNQHLRDLSILRPDEILTTAQLMLKYDDAATALSYLQKYTELEGSNLNTLRLMAKCMMKQGKYRQAINKLKQADILSSCNNELDTETILDMIKCYDRLNDLEGSFSCLTRLEKLFPESSKITVDMGLCLIKMGRFAEASQRFFKLEIKEKKVIPSMRAIAWCLFKQHKYDSALRYYKKLFNTPNAATWEDYLNGGHSSWLNNDTTTALTFYHQYIKRYLTDDSKISYALAPFDNDAEELMEHGKSKCEIELMHDIIIHHCDFPVLD